MKKPKTQPDIRAEIIENIKKIKNCRPEKIIETTNSFCDWWTSYKILLNNTIEPIAHYKQVAISE